MPSSVAPDLITVRIPSRLELLALLDGVTSSVCERMHVDLDTASLISMSVIEAGTNAIQHAYGAGEGVLDLELSVVDGAVEVVVRDHGRWRPPGRPGGGRGIPLMRGFMDSVDFDTGAGGTVARLRRRLGEGPAP